MSEQPTHAELVTQIAWLEQIKAVAGQKSAELREQLAADARAEYKKHGMGVQWKLSDLATVVLPLSQQAVYVRDPIVFLRWVKERYPDGVETVEQVRSGWQGQFLADCKVAPKVDSPGDPYDPATGEVVPGLAVRPAGVPGTLTVTVKAAAKELFAALADHGLRQLALEAGPSAPREMVSGRIPLGLPEVEHGD